MEVGHSTTSSLDDKRIARAASVIWVYAAGGDATDSGESPICSATLQVRARAQPEGDWGGSFRLTKLMEISSHYVDDDFWRSWTNTLTRLQGDCREGNIAAHMVIFNNKQPLDGGDILLILVR